MRILTILTAIILFLSCNGISPKQPGPATVSSKRPWKIHLERLNKEFSITLPNEYDTLISWHKPCQCNSNRYRIQSSLFRIYRDGCCADDSVPGDVLQITFNEPLDRFDSNEVVTSKRIIDWHKQEISYAKEDPQVQQNLYDTLLRVDDRIYSVFANMSHRLKECIYRQTVWTTFYLENRPIRIVFERSYSKIPLNRSQYIEECLSAIKTLEN